MPLLVFVAFFVGFVVTTPKPVPPGLVGSPAVRATQMPSTSRACSLVGAATGCK